MPLPKTKSKSRGGYLNKTMLLYGQPKAGKSTLVSRLGDEDNKILAFMTEAGDNFLEIYKYEVPNAKGELVNPTQWQHFGAMVKELCSTDHDFKCVAIDTVDNLYSWCSKYVCKKHGIEHVSDLGFGKAYEFVKEEFYAPINYLTQHGYGVVFISHEKTIEKEINKRKLNYTESTLGNTAKKLIHGLVDFIFYLSCDSEGHRTIRTKPTESINAGDRSGMLPEVINVDDFGLNFINELKTLNQLGETKK